MMPPLPANNQDASGLDPLNLDTPQPDAPEPKASELDASNLGATDQFIAEGGSSRPQNAAEPSVNLDDATETITQTLIDILHQFLGHLPLIVAGLVVLLLTACVSFAARRVINKILKDVRLRASLKELIARFTILSVWSLGLLITAMVVFPGLTPAKALTALGVGSIAIGLAFKDIFENLFAGVLILWRFPFENGDFIECNGFSGKVIDVTVRNTVLRTVEGEMIVVPNADIYKNAVHILTNRPKRRVDITCGVAYHEDVGTAREVIQKAVKACRTVSDDHPVQVFAKAFASSSIDFEVAWWSGSTPLEIRASRDEVVEAVKRALDEAGIEIPFPYRTLTFKDAVPVRAAKQPIQTDDESR